jgi:hypothetical protein
MIRTAVTYRDSDGSLVALGSTGAHGVWMKLVIPRRGPAPQTRLKLFTNIESGETLPFGRLTGSPHLFGFTSVNLLRRIMRIARAIAITIIITIINVVYVGGGVVIVVVGVGVAVCVVMVLVIDMLVFATVVWD